MSTVKELTGIPINYLITVNFRAFRKIVDRIDGVYIDVDRRYFNDNSTSDTYEELDLKPGYQLLMGEDALYFVRYGTRTPTSTASCASRSSSRR